MLSDTSLPTCISSWVNNFMKNLKYFPSLIQLYGHIYMYRFKPTYDVKAYPYLVYPAKCEQAKCVMHNIMNNLNPEVAQFP